MRQGIEVLRVESPRAGENATAPLRWQAVAFLPLSSLAAGVSDEHVSGMAYDGAADALYLLFGRAQPRPLLRALSLRTGAPRGDWALPRQAGPPSWSGLALSPDGGALFASHAAPAGLWRFARGKDGMLSCGAPAA